MKRNISLDALRGVAILLVVVHHSSAEVLPALPELSGLAGFIFWFLKNIGWSGVDFFFTLSGFLIGGIIFTEIERTRALNIPRFLLSRGFKIWPSYIVFVLVAFSAVNLPWVSEQGGEFSLFRALLTHLFFLQNYLPVAHPNHSWNVAIGPAWSLAVEEHFYIFLPIVLYLIRQKLRTHLIPVFATVVIIILFLRVYVSFDGVKDGSFKLSHFRFDSLLIGVTLNYLWRNNSRLVGWIKQKDWSLLFFCLPVIALCHVYSRNSIPMFTLGFVLLSIAYSILLILSFENWHRTLESSRLAVGLSHIGKWSYNIYLWHCLWPLFFRPQISAFNSQLVELYLPAFVIVIINILMYGAISIAIGYFFTMLVENKFLILRRKIIRTRFTPFR